MPLRFQNRGFKFNVLFQVKCRAAFLKIFPDVFAPFLGQSQRTLECIYELSTYELRNRGHSGLGA